MVEQITRGSGFTGLRGGRSREKSLGPKDGRADRAANGSHGRRSSRGEAHSYLWNDLKRRRGQLCDHRDSSPRATEEGL